MIDEFKISSKDNPKIKYLKKLESKKYRKEYGEFLVENFTIIRDSLSAGYKPVSLFATPEFAYKHEKELEEVRKQSGLKSWFEISNQINKSFSSLKTPSGITAVYEIPKEKKINIKKSVIYLNSIGDPGNLGTIMRSALAFGLKTIVLDETCADPYNYKTINAAKDSIFKINIAYDKNLSILTKLQSEMKLISTRMKNAKNVKDIGKLNKACIILGDETKGVDKEIQDLSDEFVSINISKEIESLNVASAAAIIFYEMKLFTPVK